MTSSSASANQQPQLMNGNEDAYKPEGRIELKIENLSGFVQEAIGSQQCSDPVHVRGTTWKISARIHECDRPGSDQKQKCLGYYLLCHGAIDPSWSCSTTGSMKVLAQKEEKGKDVDHVRKFDNVFNAKTYYCGFAQYMTFENLMNPESGWYDEQFDSMTLAVDLTVGTAKGVGEYMLVAENEFKLNKVPTSFSMQIGQLEWEVDFDYDDQEKKEGGKSLVLSCTEVAKARTDKVLIELFGYHRVDPKSDIYSRFPVKGVYRHVFTRNDNSLTVKIPDGCILNNLLFTIKVSKERNQFPDFTKLAVKIGRFSADVKLRVGDQQFHANKQMLSTHSLFFDRMFHGDYTAATQQEVELSLNTHSAELFHQFLLVMSVNEILPNFMNLTALFKLADFYDAENVYKKCDQHLRAAREMPIEKRMLMARDHGSEETQALILDSANPEQLKKISLLLMKSH